MRGFQTGGIGIVDAGEGRRDGGFAGKEEGGFRSGHFGDLICALVEGRLVGSAQLEGDIIVVDALFPRLSVDEYRIFDMK